MGPAELQIRVRILAAARFLRNSPNRSIEDVASAVGYRSVNKLYNVVRTRISMTPGELRGVSEDRLRRLLALPSWIDVPS
jgi:transcriptional regulator GlxA family with amidase domain